MYKLFPTLLLVTSLIIPAAAMQRQLSLENHEIQSTIDLIKKAIELACTELGHTDLIALAQKYAVKNYEEEIEKNKHLIDAQKNTSPRAEIARLLDSYGSLMNQLIKKARANAAKRGRVEELLAQVKILPEYPKICEIEGQILAFSTNRQPVKSLEHPWRWHPDWIKRARMLLTLLTALQLEWQWFNQDCAKQLAKNGKVDARTGARRYDLLAKNVNRTGLLHLGDLSEVNNLQELIRSLDI